MIYFCKKLYSCGIWRWQLKRILMTVRRKLAFLAFKQCPVL
jgi:hypothetical protein